MSSNPILDGIATGHSLLSKSEALSQQKWRDRVSADQYDRAHNLQTKKFDELKRVQKRAEELQLGQATYAKAYELNKQARDALDGTPEGKKRFEELTNQRNALISQGMQSNSEFRKWIRAVGGAAGAQGSVTTANDGAGHFTTIKSVVAQADGVDSQGNPVKKGDPVNVIGGGTNPDGSPNMLTTRDGSGNIQLISEYDMDAIFGEDSNEYWKAGSVAQSQQHDLIEDQTARLGKTNDAVSSSQTQYVKSLGGVQNAQANLDAFNQYQTSLGGGGTDETTPKVTDVNPRTLRVTEENYSSAITTRDKSTNTQMHRAGKIVTNKSLDQRSEDLAGASKAVRDLVSVGSPKAEEATKEHVEYLEKELSRVGEKLASGGYQGKSWTNLGGLINTQDENAAAYYDVIKSELASFQNAGGAEAEAEPKFAPEVMERLAGLSVPEQRKVLEQELKIATKALDSAKGGMSKAILEQRRINIEVAAKLGFSGNMEMMNDIMNGFSMSDMSRLQIHREKMKNTTDQAYIDYLQDNREGVSKELDKIVNEVPGKSRENSWQVHFRRTMMGHALQREGYFTPSDVHMLREGFEEAASFLPQEKIRTISLDIGKAVYYLKKEGLLTEDMDDDDKYSALQTLTTQAGRASTAGETMYDVLARYSKSGMLRQLMSGQ